MTNNGNQRDDLRAAMAASQSYTGKAFITLIAYMFLWLPGLLLNYLWWRDGRANERLAKQKLPGATCLEWLLYLQLLGIVAFVVFLAVTIFGAAGTQP